jgi:hypothetical protein
LTMIPASFSWIVAVSFSAVLNCSSSLLLNAANRSGNGTSSVGLLIRLFKILRGRRIDGPKTQTMIDRRGSLRPSNPSDVWSYRIASPWAGLARASPARTNRLCLEKSAL